MSTTLTYFIGFSIIYILMTWSLYLPYRVGQLHFLTVACMAVSAYFSGIAALEWSWSFPAVLITGTIISALISYLISFVIGEAPTFTVVIVGITMIYIVKTAIENTDFLGGTMGYFGIPPVDNLIITAFFTLVLVGVVIFRIEHSQLGRAAAVIFTDKEMAKTLGIKIKSLGMFYQTMGGALGGIAGVFYAYLAGSLFPDFFSFHLVGTLVCMLFVGGYTTMWGAVLSALILGGFPILLPSAISSWRVLIYGVLLVGIILLRPEGLITRKLLVRSRNVEINK